MAIIDGKQPEPDQRKEWSPRVVLKLRRREDPDSFAGAEAEERAAILEKLPGVLTEIAPDARLESYLGDEDAAQLSSGRSGRLGDYFAVTLPPSAAFGDAVDAEGLAKRLNALDEVETAYVEGAPTPPPLVNAADDPRATNQGYLDAAPDGIDARWAWDHADGRNVGFVDLEQGWTLDHEDLAGAGITLISGISNAYIGHGTAVLGEVVAVDNTIGGVGIAPRASARVVSQWRSSSVYSTAAAILSAVDAMSAGDVLLLEAQTQVGGSTYLPVEVEQAVFDAIVAATDAGIIVVEAAGNGGNDLDEYTDAAGHHILRRGDEHFRDSGAIMVGAATSSAPHARLGFSNFGSRIDCFGWGQSIDTTGDGWEGTSTTSYTSGFGGTSGASPIVTGAALLVQSFRRRWRRRVFGPSELRELLTSNLNTPSNDPPTDRIGVMPNLRAILEMLIDEDRFRIPFHLYEQWVYILFGVIDDSPGVIWVPGRGPVPVDPDWRGIGAKGLAQFSQLLARQLDGVAGAQLDPEQVHDATRAALQGMVQG